MPNKQNVINFINYNYTPFKKLQCIERLICLWIISIIMCLIGNGKTIWLCVFSIINISVTIVFSVLIFKYPGEKASRFICDGITSLYASIILNLSSYKFFALNTDGIWIMAIVLLILLFACIAVFVVITFRNIASDLYSSKNKQKISAWPFIGATCGILFARIFLVNLLPESYFTILAILLLLLSFVSGIGSINLLKAYFLKKLTDTSL